jgi:predicted TIM-barrel fold metal-dependent hydrolase
MGPAWGQPRRGGAQPGLAPVAPGGPKILDVHAHLFHAPQSDMRDAVRPALEAMDRLEIARSLLMPPPQPPGHRTLYDFDSFLPLIRPHAGRLGFLGGGGTLNTMLHRNVPVTEVIKRDFTDTAERIIRAGAAGFGEITAHHVSYFPQHPYETVTADHPLLRLLADIAERHDVPIDLHLDPIPGDMPTPPRLADRSSANPRVLTANLDGFERLLSHNRGASIVWAHAGRDTLGTWTVALTRGLLERHPNLFLSLTMHPPFGVVAENSLLDAGGQANPAWVDLLRDFPDRAVIGSDFFHQPTGRDGSTLPPPSATVRRFVNALPAALGLHVAHQNATRLYRQKLA